MVHHLVRKGLIILRFDKIRVDVSRETEPTSHHQNLQRLVETYAGVCGGTGLVIFRPA
jgi:hypothetical protein